MNYTLTRSQRRRTIGIKIQHGQVRVSAPTGVANEKIAAFVTSQRDWIRKHLESQRAHINPLPLRQWQHGEYLYWLGQKIELQVRAGQRNTVEYFESDNILQVRLSRRITKRNDKVRQLVTNWYCEQAQQWLDATIPSLTATTKLKPAGWCIRNYRGKWGACSSTGALSFSWRLFAAPLWVVIYVIHHELCHLVHFNHSKAFWALLQSHEPNLQKSEKWLKNQGIGLLNDAHFHYVKEL